MYHLCKAPWLRPCAENRKSSSSKLLSYFGLVILLHEQLLGRKSSNSAPFLQINNTR